MTEPESVHQRLERQIDCQMEVKPRDALAQWEKDGWKEEPGTDGDEAPIKYISLAILEAVEERAVRLTADKDMGVTIHADQSYNLPKAPPEYIARGLEILREIAGLEGPAGEGKIALGLRNDSVELILQKDAGLHTISIPRVAEIPG